MTVKEARAKIKLFRRRRGHLKTALRKEARFFDMTLWFTGGTEATAKLKSAFLASGPLGSAERKRIHKNYESCGTACCIAGLDFLRSGRRLADIVEFYGFEPRDRTFLKNDSPVFYSGRWPSTIWRKYKDAQGSGDHATMAEAGCEAIDYFGRLGDEYLLSSATVE